MALLLCMTVQTAFAAEGGNEKEYTYTVTLSAGNQGTFNGTGGVHVIGGSAQISGGDAIRITGLRAGDVVVLAGKGHETYQEVNHVKHHMELWWCWMQLLEWLI